MGINIELLENKVRLPNGDVRARCPACALKGNDKRGEHLMLFASGKFGCTVHPGDRAHRQEIYRLVGDNCRESQKAETCIKISVNPKPGWKGFQSRK